MTSWNGSREESRHAGTSRFAHKALTAEPLIGLLMPCNVVLLEEDDGTVTASFVNPKEMFKVVENAELAVLAGEVDGMLRAALDSLA